MIKTFGIVAGAMTPLLPGLAHAHHEGATDLSTGLGIVILLATAFAALLAARSLRSRSRDR